VSVVLESADLKSFCDLLDLNVRWGALATRSPVVTIEIRSSPGTGVAGPKVSELE
jgi:hypothetical protein